MKHPNKRKEWEVSDILRDPLLNKDAAFTPEERERLGLGGMLPSAVLTIQQQMTLELDHIFSKKDALEQYVGLISLLERNKTLFYRLILEKLDWLLPLIYTPTVVLASRKFSHLFRRPHGLFISPMDRGKIVSNLKNLPCSDIRLFVVTDNEHILGMGDQGVGGIAISLGKSILYTAGAGIHPDRVVPVTLDVGTDNDVHLNDPYYLGYRKKRIRGPEYDSLVHEFVEAVHEVFPRAVIQWEDFHRKQAFTLLDRYKDQIPCFNDDIQGSAAATLAGILNGLRVTGGKLCDQRYLIFGAGMMGVGLSRLLYSAMQREGLDETAIRNRLMLMDSKGIVAERSSLESYKEPFSWNASSLSELHLDQPIQPDLKEVITAFKPTVLVGASGQPHAFHSEVIRAMTSHCERPIIFPMSHPTQRAECTVFQALTYSNGKALVASGLPSESMHFGDREFLIGQNNNLFLFPGVGLGAMVSEARSITDDMFIAAAKELALSTSEDRLAKGALYPDINDLQSISRRIAFRVALLAARDQVGLPLDGSEIQNRIDQTVWNPQYPDFVSQKFSMIQSQHPTSNRPMERIQIRKILS